MARGRRLRARLGRCPRGGSLTIPHRASTPDRTAAAREHTASHAHRGTDRPRRSSRLADPDRSDLRRPGPPLPLRVGDRVTQADGSGDFRARPRTDRRGTPHPRPSRRQPRRRGTRAAPCCGNRHHDHLRRETTRRQHSRTRAMGVHADPGIRATVNRHHRDALPARSTTRACVRRRRDRLRAALGRPGARRALDLGRHRAVRRGSRGRQPPARSAWRFCTSVPRASRSPGRCTTR